LDVNTLAAILPSSSVAVLNYIAFYLVFFSSQSKWVWWNVWWQCVISSFWWREFE